MDRLSKTLVLLTFAGVTLLLPVVTAGQMSWHVDDDCTPPGAGSEVDPFCTIQDGVDAAQDGDTVLVQPGLYTGDGNRDISLFGKSITLRSAQGSSATLMDIQGGPTAIHRGFFLVHGETRETVIEGFTIVNGYLIGDTGGEGTGTPGGGGGAIFLRDSSPTIRGCILKDNVSERVGNPFIADGLGGAVYVDGGSHAFIQNCIILNNYAGNRGGGLYIGFENSRVVIANCLIAENATDPIFSGGGVYLTFGNALITNTAILNNGIESFAGGFYNEGGEAFVRNCIFWGNAAAVGTQIYVNGHADLTIEYSDIEGGLAGVQGSGVILWGAGMIESNPLFVDPEKGDFRLLFGSPCIDAGNNFAVPGDLLVDMDGFARFADHLDTPDTGNGDGVLGIVDMGPYEFGGHDCNNNGTPDTEDVVSGDSDDCDANNIPDECEPDCNHNGQADLCDLTAELSDDCDANIRPDECQIIADSPAPGGPFYCIADTNSCDPDCNTNGVIDECDIAAETSIDCNANIVPDECEPDCNDNGQVDECDITDGFSDDCNFNYVPDECEVTLPIPQQPQDQGAEPGEMAFFGVVVEAFLPSFQWRKDGVDLQDDGRIVGSQGPLLIILDVIPEDAGEYDCFIIDLITGCENTSDPATLTVHGPCPADFDGSGAVGPFDLAFLLGHWGPNPKHPADLDADGTVGPPDLALLLGAWGPCS